MTRPRSPWSLKLSIILLATILSYACQERATDPSTGITFRLIISDTGSTTNGEVISDRGGIDCLIAPTVSGTTLTGICDKELRKGTVVALTAVPPEGTTALWTGCDDPVTDSPLTCRVTMNGERRPKVQFGPRPTSLTLSVTGGAGGNGSVQSDVAGINCTIAAGNAGASGCSAAFKDSAVVTLTAVAATGSYLKAWVGGWCELRGTGRGTSTGTCVVTVTESRLVVVSFETRAPAPAMGLWKSPMPWPAVAIHAELLPNGLVMTWGRNDHVPVLWDPNGTGGFRTAARPADFFCSGHAFLPDGRLLVAGGHSGTDDLGIKTTYLYDFASNSWSRGPDMQNGRWYPTNTAMPNGEVVTLAGSDTTEEPNLIPEVYQADGTWRVLSTASKQLPLYPMAFAAPDGRVFVAGPDQASRWLDPSGTGHWTVGPSSNYGSRSYGSAVMYDQGKILLVGGGSATATAEVIDLNTGGPWRTIAPMSVGRRQMNATILADGQVLVTGGTNVGGFNNAPTTSAVLAAELWNPVTEQWRTLARMTHHRVYHSTALLLPDGRVLSAGSGQPAATGLPDDYTAEIFSPPYLFNADGTLATRPNLDNVPAVVSYGQTITVTTTDPASIAKATWIRLSAVTHAQNQNQRLNYLAITGHDASTVTLQLPAGPNLAPPGHYMLFLVNAAGVPSVAKIVQIR